jgi:hypothetical protein
MHAPTDPRAHLRRLPASRRSRRARAAGATLAWLATAAVATVATSVAVGAIGSGILPSAEPPLQPDEVDRRLAAAPAPTTATPQATTAPAVTTTQPSPAAVPTVLSSQGGLVLARCTPGPEVVSTVPAQGYGVKDIEPEDGGQRVRFESGHTRVEVLVTCTAGVPRATIRTH